MLDSDFEPLVGQPVAIGGRIDGNSFVGVLLGCSGGVLTVEEADGSVWLINASEVAKIGRGPPVTTAHERGKAREEAKREHDATCPVCNPPPPKPALSPEELATIERCGSLVERMEDDGR